MISTVVVLAVLAVMVWLLVAPLQRGETDRVVSAEESARDELEALKEAKYREIRDAELDFRTGKLSEEDYRRTDRALRAEAVDILRRIDDLGA